MNVTVRVATLPADLSAIRAVHNRNRRRPASMERFEWGYLRNPAGLARAWLAVDDATGLPVGCGAVHPRRMLANGQPVLGWTTGDLSVDPSFRGRGVAVLIRSAAREEIDKGAAALLYTHPNPLAARSHARVGNLPLGRMVSHVKFLRVPLGPAGLRRASALVLRPLGRITRTVGEIELISKAPLSEGLDDLTRSRAPELGLAVERSAAYLGWRFLDCPFERTSLLVLRRGGVRAYLVFAASGKALLVKDWLAATPGDFHMIVSSLVQHARKEGAESITVEALEGHPDLPRLLQHGFFRRPHSTLVMAYAPPASPLRPLVLDRRRWYMTAGDRDV